MIEIVQLAAAHPALFAQLHVSRSSAPRRTALDTVARGRRRVAASDRDRVPESRVEVQVAAARNPEDAFDTRVVRPTRSPDLNQHRAQLIPIRHRLDPRAMKYDPIDVAALQATIFGRQQEGVGRFETVAATLQLRLIVGDELARTLLAAVGAAACRGWRRSWFWRGVVLAATAAAPVARAFPRRAHRRRCDSHRRRTRARRSGYARGACDDDDLLRAGRVDVGDPFEDDDFHAIPRVVRQRRRVGAGAHAADNPTKAHAILVQLAHADAAIRVFSAGSRRSRSCVTRSKRASMSSSFAVTRSRVPSSSR